MATLFINKLTKTNQFLFGILLLLIVSIVCFAVSGVIGYKVVGFILLITVSLLAMVLDIVPIICIAAMSALVWNFFFIPPKFTFHIGSAEDAILFAMYFVVAIVSAVLTYKIRQMEKATQRQQQKENTVKLYNTMLNSLSHELRTPIAAIIGATDNLQSSNEKLTPQNKNDLVAEIAKASFRLNQQVENLLNMSRLESGIIKPKNDWCDILEVVYDAVKRLEENNVSQKISININPAIPLFKVDKGMLEQIIYNIVNNAAQYTNSHCVINISATGHADMLEIIIEDNGKGFPPEEIHNVFDKFYRLKNASTGGTGLGLSIVKGFAEAMGGSVHLQNAVTRGAVFTINIPAETSYLKNLKNE